MISTILYWLMLPVVGTFAPAETSGTATGTLTVNGKATELSYAEALETKDWALGPNQKFVEVTVIKVCLSDEPVSDEEDNFDTFLRGSENKLHAVLLTFSAKGEVTDGILIHQAFTNGAITLSGSDVARFERKSLDSKMIAGKVSGIKTEEFKGAAFNFSVSFSAQIQHEPKPTLEGSAAATSGPGIAVQEFIRAAEAKDLAALKSIFRPEIAKLLEDPEHKEEVTGLLENSYPAGKEFKIVRVFDFGDRAWVEAASKRPSESGGAPVDETYRIRTVRINGVWKVQPM